MDDAQTLPAAAAEPGAAESAEPSRVLLHMPVNVRSAALVVIAVLLGIFALHWAGSVFIPVLIGLMVSYALAPVVDALARAGLPRSIGAGLVLLSIVGGLGWAGYALRDDANSLIETLPEAARKLRGAVAGVRSQPKSNIDIVQQAATQIEQAAADSAAAAKSAPPKGVARVQIEKPAFNVKDYLVVGALRLMELAAQFLVVCFVAYFLLAAGDAFRRKMARIAGPTFAKRRLTVQALNEIGEQIQRYLAVQLLTSVLVGVATGLAFWAIGLEHAAVWGVAAAALNLIPYLGSIVLAGVASVVALTQFGSLEKALLVGGICVALHFVSGYLLTPWLTSRTSQLNAVAVFVGVLAWGWLWGVAGLLLGAPILMAVKAVCDRVDDLKPIGELMGSVEPSD